MYIKKNLLFTKFFILVFALTLIILPTSLAQTCVQSKHSIKNKILETDTYNLQSGTLQITFIGHASLMLKWNDSIIYIDPWSELADYSQFPKADLILITHNHYDHFDKIAIEQVVKKDTTIISPPSCKKLINNSIFLKNNETTNWHDIKITAFPAYNIIHKNAHGKLYHPKGEGNGYIISKENFNIYIAGDTENIPEMKDLQNIDIAFLPMNLPFTMTPEMVASAAVIIKPKILYPYHYSDTNPKILVKLLNKYAKEIDVRIKNMQ